MKLLPTNENTSSAYPPTRFSRTCSMGKKLITYATPTVANQNAMSCHAGHMTHLTIRRGGFSNPGRWQANGAAPRSLSRGRGFVLGAGGHRRRRLDERATSVS